jgi:hypothetical protein
MILMVRSLSTLRLAPQQSLLSHRPDPRRTEPKHQEESAIRLSGEITPDNREPRAGTPLDSRTPACTTLQAQQDKTGEKGEKAKIAATAYEQKDNFNIPQILSDP